MNAITVNYAEVGNDHLPVSFGFVRDIDLNNQTVYNSEILKIEGTAYSVLQSRDIGTKDIIVSSDAKSSRLLSNFTAGPTSWINHRIPDSDSTAYIFYKDDGYYYKMLEDENGLPIQTKYAPYAYLTEVRDNAGIQPYCEATIEAPVELQVSTGSVKAVIDSNPVEIISIDHNLNLQLENTDNDNFTSQLVTESEYTIGSDFNLENIEWLRDNQSVSPWLSDNKIIKSSKSSNGKINQIKLLIGDNLVKIFRKRAKLTVHFTFDGDASSFEAAGAYCNSNEDSYMSGNDLIIPQVKYGRSAGGSLLGFITNADADWFNNNTALLSSEFKGATTENRTVTINMSDIVDTIMFTGWYANKVVSNQKVLQQHTTLKTTYELTSIDNNKLSNIAVTDNDGLLTWDGSGSKKFTRHRQLHYTHWERNGDEVGYINSNKFLKEDGIIVDDTTTPGTYDVKGVIGFVSVVDDRKSYLYADENNTSHTFYAEAYYNGIPSAVPVTTINHTATATADQVVLFRGNYYVENLSMQTLVKKLTGVIPLIATEHYDDWSVDKSMDYYELTYNSSGAYDYKQCQATITFSGNGSQITSVKSSTPDVTVQLVSQTIAQDKSIIASVKATVVNPDLTSYTDGFSFNGSDAEFSSLHEEDYSIGSNQWDKHYQFF